MQIGRMNTLTRLTTSLSAAPFAACLASVLVPTASGQAPAYPDRPVRVVVGSAAGGNADILARIVCNALSRSLDQQFVVDNRGGATGAIGTEIAAKARPDGYTLMYAASNHAINPSLNPRLPWDAVKDFAPIGLVALTPLVLTITNTLPAKSVRELIDLARAKPAGLALASAGTGSPGHLAGVLFDRMSHVTMLHVPYKATQQAMTDLTTGQVQVMYPTLTAVLPQVRAGKLRGLAITSRARSALAPDLPTMEEAGLRGYEASIWNGFLAPARTPSTIISKLEATLLQIMQTQEIKDHFAAIGAEPLTSTPAEFGRFIAGELAKWSRVIREAGVRIE
jgi:tripartite-type tricarboxylate transporter receptor subunit TctC